MYGTEVGPKLKWAPQVMVFFFLTLTKYLAEFQQAPRGLIFILANPSSYLALIDQVYIKKYIY